MKTTRARLVAALTAAGAGAALALAATGAAATTRGASPPGPVRLDHAS